MVLAFPCISRFSNIFTKVWGPWRFRNLRRAQASAWKCRPGGLSADGKVSVSKTHRCLWQFYCGWDLLGLCFVLLKPGLRLQVFWKSQVAKWLGLKQVQCRQCPSQDQHNFKTLCTFSPCTLHIDRSNLDISGMTSRQYQARNSVDGESYENSQTDEWDIMRYLRIVDLSSLVDLHESGQQVLSLPFHGNVCASLGFQKHVRGTHIHRLYRLGTWQFMWFHRTANALQRKSQAQVRLKEKVPCTRIKLAMSSPWATCPSQL